MKTGRGWWALAGVIAGSIIILVGGYVCAYYMLANQARLVFWSTTSKLEENVTVVYPECNWLNLSSFFAPIHKLDRQLIRPKWWAPDVSRYPIEDGVPRISD